MPRLGLLGISVFCGDLKDLTLYNYKGKSYHKWPFMRKIRQDNLLSLT